MLGDGGSTPYRFFLFCFAQHQFDSSVLRRLSCNTNTTCAQRSSAPLRLGCGQTHTHTAPQLSPRRNHTHTHTSNTHAHRAAAIAATQSHTHTHILRGVGCSASVTRTPHTHIHIHRRAAQLHVATHTLRAWEAAATRLPRVCAAGGGRAAGQRCALRLIAAASSRVCGRRRPGSGVRCD
jgi:hypothetical protein